ncbi:hypothetical protein NUSPORA_02984 [Nucleospora cyclopteri]
MCGYHVFLLMNFDAIKVLFERLTIPELIYVNPFFNAECLQIFRNVTKYTLTNRSERSILVMLLKYLMFKYISENEEKVVDCIHLFPEEVSNNLLELSFDQKVEILRKKFWLIIFDATFWLDINHIMILCEILNIEVQLWQHQQFSSLITLTKHFFSYSSQNATSKQHIIYNVEKKHFMATIPML